MPRRVNSITSAARILRGSLSAQRDASRAAFAAPEPRALIAEFLARGGQTVSGERRLAELLGELNGSDR